MARRKNTITQKTMNSWQDKIAEILVILMMCVQPLYFNQHRYRGLTGHKYNFFFICMCVVLAVVVIVLIVKLVQGLKILPRKRPSVTEIALLGFALVTLLSAFFTPFAGALDVQGRSVDVWNGVPERHDGAFTQLFYVAIFFIIAHWYKPRMRDFGLFGISASVIGLIGVFQFYGMDFFRLWPNEPGSQYRVENFYNIFFRSTLGNINIVSTYVCVAILLCGFLFIRAEPQWKPWRVIWFAGSGLNFWLMVLAGSNSGMVGVILTTFLVVPFIIDSRKHIGRFLLIASSWAGTFMLQKLFYDFLILKTESGGRIGLYAFVAVVLLAGGLVLTVFRKKKLPEADSDAPIKWKLSVIMMAAVIAVGITGVEVLGRRTGEDAIGRGRISELREVLHGNVNDEFGSNRIYIWRNALEAFPDSPNIIIGNGPDTFEHVFPAEAQFMYGQFYDKAHNEYLQILICQGVLGLLFYLVFLGTLFGRAIPRAFRNPLLMAVLAGFTGYCVQAFFNISLPIASQMLWVMAGVMYSSMKAPLNPAL